MQLIDAVYVNLNHELDAVIEGVTRTVPTAEIILFGSYAYGTPHQDSDIDICVLTFNDDSRSHAWWTKIRSSFRVSVPLDLIVYPKDEFEKRAKVYSFEKEIRAKGMTIYMSQTPQSPAQQAAQDWYNIAKQDMDSAEQTMRYVPNPSLRMICYQCQQSVEKALKGVLIENGVSAPRTHDLEMLRQLCEQHVSPMFAQLQNTCVSLTAYSIVIRYPDAGEPSLAETQDALKDGKSVLAFLSSHGYNIPKSKAPTLTIEQSVQRDMLHSLYVNGKVQSPAVKEVLLAFMQQQEVDDTLKAWRQEKQRSKSELER